MEERRVVDYFVVVGASDEQSHDDINSTHLKQSLCSDLPPITDLAIVFPSLGEKVPSDFIVVDTTPSGLIADLNHGSLRSPEVFLCYRRGRDKPPIVDIGIMYDGKERVLKDAQVLKTTVSGEVANINNSTSSKTFITYRRALPTAPCNILAVSHICVVITSRGETPPHAFCLIHKNLNKGMVGSDVYLCYKKSVMKPKSITYKPVITNRYPKEDRNYFHLLPSVALFCLPMGATLEAWPNQASQPKPVFSTFVLTVSDASEKVYGAAITFYEKFSGNLSNEQKELLGLNEHHNELKNGIGLHSNKSICVLSHWPFFDTFEKFLMFLLNTSLGDKIHIPVERYITHLVDEVPFPSPERPQILVQLSMDTQLILTQPEDLPIPRSGAGFHQMIMNLHPDNCLLLLLCALTEQKLLIHSLRPDVLTAVAEAISSLIFPFKWQCPYIPLCPLSLAEVLHAPLPFLIGVDSRFFDLYEPPTDVTCVDLDTNTVTLCEDKKYLSIKLLPKKSARVLKYTLEKLYEKLDELQTSFHTSNNKNFGETSIDKDILMKRKEHELELNIQEAFLRFMGSILKGYRWFLRPITKAPTAGTTDTSSLFDLLGFLKSRDKSNQKFYSLLTKTQMFIRFIEERSFVSNMDAALEFFDECSEKIDSENSPTRLIELDSCGQSERTVFIMPPEMSDMPNMVPYSYKNGFILNSEILKCKDSKNQLKIKNDDHLPIPGSPMARRTKHEVKSAQKLAKKYSTSPGLWAKFLLGTCYSLWFIHLPSHILQSEDRAASILRLAYDLLNKFQKNGVQRLTDEVCYRVMMQLCGIYNQPMLAVKLLLVMKRCGLHPNAITYGFYNRALLESTWPSDLRTHSQLLWNKLRNVVICTALFKQAGLQNRKRRSSTEDEKTSHTSEESLLTAEKQSSVSNTPRKLSINVESNYGLRARPISIVKQNSLSPEDDQSWSSQQFESSAGLLMTTTCSRPSSASSKPNSDSVSVESETDLKSPSSFSGKKSNEILMGGLTSLKSAANTVVKKFDEIKEAISTNNTPIKDYIQCSKDEDKWIDDVDHQFNEPSVRRKISSEISSLAVAQHFDSWSTNLIELFTDGHKKSGSCNINSGFDTLDFSELSLFQEKLYQRSIRTTELVALEIIMTTCSKCHNCGCLLFDEEIMSGWVPDDSNLNTKCRLCNKDVVPFLTIDIIDYRSKDVYLNEIDDQNKISNFNLLTDNVKEKGTSKNCYRTDTITVPYLNPLVLRKELESILAAEGDVSLTHYKFVDEHPIIYWNLVWIFERIDVPSHISGLCLNAASILGDRDITTFHSIWSSCDSSNVLIINLWDNPKLYDDIGLPMYSFWSNEETKESCLISALVTDRNTIPKNLMTKVIASIRRNNLTDPLKKLAFERNKLRGNDLSHSHSLYRDILFLTITAIGRENIDISAFDQEYLIAFENLSENESKILLKCDHPISIGSQYCRHLFKELELSNYK
ncbi:DENN domain-containing protein Crag isoform X3 [Daktulosphaira vitifoliae]|uniref:DENN domain-containing protein Crag isoform X3 n=1 Tax=Daktulosphaira vitifoliae TaxID=58002 RepID=UPI0021AA4BA6|nr:DENN domain-containing protein Crag isoform X3 [Daktulosphaira vitifoliae]